MKSSDFQSLLSLSENRSRIFAVVVAMVQDYDLADDLFQDAIAEILRSEETFDPNRSFPAWACGIARNVVRQHWRKQKNAPTTGVCDLLNELAEIVEDGGNELWKRERRALRSCFQRLPESMQRLLILRYGHNVKGSELAESASIRIGSLRTTLARLRQQLRKCIRLRTLESEAS